MSRRAKKTDEIMDLVLLAALSYHYVRARVELHAAHKLIFAQDISQQRRRQMWKAFLAEIARP